MLMSKVDALIMRHQR